MSTRKSQPSKFELKILVWLAETAVQLLALLAVAYVLGADLSHLKHFGEIGGWVAIIVATDCYSYAYAASKRALDGEF